MLRKLVVLCSTQLEDELPRAGYIASRSAHPDCTYFCKVANFELTDKVWKAFCACCCMLLLLSLLYVVVISNYVCHVMVVVVRTRHHLCSEVCLVPGCRRRRLNVALVLFVLILYSHIFVLKRHVKH